MALDPAKMTHKELRATLLQVMVGAEQTEAELRAQLEAERAERARERAQMAAQMAELERLVDQLRAEITRLKGGGSGATSRKNSSNSSMPPSMDDPTARGARSQKRSLREASDRPPGGQVGHGGARLEPVSLPDQVLVHEPVSCAGCGNGLPDVAGQVVSWSQVTDIPEVITASVTEHQVIEKPCDCGQISVGELPYGVTESTCSYGPNLSSAAVYLHTVQHVPISRVAQVLQDMYGVSVSTGWVDAVVTRAGKKLQGSVAAIGTHIRQVSVAHFDETPVRVNGSIEYVHTASSQCATLLHAGPGRDIAGIEAGGVLPGFTGVAIHDEYAPYFGYQLPQAHGICLAHRIRDLNAASERGDTWSQKMRELLYQIKHRVEEAQAEGRKALPLEVIKEFRDRYRQIIHHGQAEHPHRRSTTTGGKTAQSESRNLLVRFRDRQAETLLFMTDFRVPFTNNLAEQSVRMVKVNQKITGGRRARSGVERFVTIRSVIQTTVKQALNTKQVLLDAFTVPNYVIPLPHCATTNP